MSKKNAKQKAFNILLSCAKFLIAGSLLLWLFKSGKIDLSILKESFTQHPNTWFMAMSMLLSMELLVAFRWKMILQTKTEKPISYIDALKFSWIGLFFNPLLPGAVSGDLIKVYYARELDKNFSTNFLFTSVFFDRIIGLSGLILTMAAIMLVNHQRLLAMEGNINWLYSLNIILLTGVFGVLVFLFSPEKLQKIFLSLSSKLPVVGAQASHFLENLWIVGKQKSVVFKALVLSMFCQSLSVGSFYILSAPYFDAPLSFMDFFTIAPVGFITIAIPIAPMGIGVGNAIFDTLFGLFNLTKGASLFNFSLLSTSILCLMGVVPYLLHSKKIDFEEIENLEETI